MSKELLQLALNSDDQVVSIYNVAPGKACNCYFLDEKKNKIFLVAKNNGKSIDKPLLPGEKTAHFARTDGKDVANFARESMIHLLAKQVLREYKSIDTPELIILNTTFYKQQKITFESVELEKIIKSNEYLFQPDAVGYTKTKEIFIEFFKTHQVDENKHEKIKKHGKHVLK